MNAPFYLYGIFPQSIPGTLELQGLDKQPVSCQEIDGFYLLYSAAKQKKYLTSRRNLLCHEKVLEDAMNEGFRTLLPLQFGLVVKNWEAVSKQLTRPYEQELKELFEKLAGKREVSVKIFWNNQSEIEGLLAANPELKERRDAMQGKALSMEEVIEIGQAIEGGLEIRKEEVIQTFRDALDALAEEVIEGETMTEEMIYNSAYLIPWEEEELFSEKVEAIDSKFSDRLRIRYNNFTAPYTFAQLSASPN